MSGDPSMVAGDGTGDIESSAGGDGVDDDGVDGKVEF